MRMSFTFSKRHESLLRKLAKKLDISMVETLQRSLESLEEKEVDREQKVNVDFRVRGESNSLENLSVVSKKG